MKQQAECRSSGLSFRSNRFVISSGDAAQRCCALCSQLEFALRPDKIRGDEAR